MRILIVSQYFWPEYFRINELAEYLIKRNCKLDVLTGIPNYPGGKIFKSFKENPEKYKNFKGAKIFRLPLIPRKSSNKFWLFLNYISFIFSGFILAPYILKNRKYDAIFTFGTSPIIVGLLSNYIANIKKCKSFLWVLDFWPEILMELKIIRNKIIYNFLDKVVKKIYKDTNYIFAQSITFKKLITDKVENGNFKVKYLPSWPESLNNAKKKIKLKKSDLKDKLKIVFTGNVGEAQNFDNILKVMKYFSNHKNICWIIVGSGRKLNNIREVIDYHNITNVIFEGNQPSSKITQYHKFSDVLLISLSDGKYLSGTIPGKLQTYLNTNKIILGMISGEAARVIKESKSGYVVAPNNIKGMISKIKFILKNKEKLLLSRKKINTKKYLFDNYSKSKILDYLLRFIKNNYQFYKKIKLIKDVKKIPFDKNFVLSGLNLAFLGFYFQKKIKLYNELYHWPDGIFARKIFNHLEIKIPGRKIIQNLVIPQTIKRIYILGQLSTNSQKYLKKLYNKKIIHINLPFGSVDKIFGKIKFINFKKSDLIILTIPTPKQEQIAEKIRSNNKFYKVLCIGGAINMASGEERPVPDFLDTIGLEFLWRLKTDPARRLSRLFKSYFSYLNGVINKSNLDLETKIIR